MYLICYGTRPEIIKLFPLIECFERDNWSFKTLFSGQHPDLYKQFKSLLPKPDYQLTDIMCHGQSLNQLSSKIMAKMDDILQDEVIKYVIVQGDTTTAYTIAMSAFHNKKKVIHLEAGLRSHQKYDPYPEEVNRSLISRIASIHLCPTTIAVENLKRENITNNVYLVGNTVVDAFKLMSGSNTMMEQKNILVTLHRRENREKMKIMWDQLNELAKTTRLIYILHPSLKEASDYLDDRIMKLNGVCYDDMVGFIKSCVGIITDSGGLQEEAVCAGKRVLVCRETTERPETIESGWGKLVGTRILENIDFLYEKGNNQTVNPYGENVCEKIVGVLKKG